LTEPFPKAILKSYRYTNALLHYESVYALNSTASGQLNSQNEYETTTQTNKEKSYINSDYLNISRDYKIYRNLLHALSVAADTAERQ
jgi:hypothetical protein